MGEEQGAACRDAIRRSVAAAGIARRGRLPFSLLPFAAGNVLGAGVGLEIVRHYAHLSERIQGLARGAGLPIESLMEIFVRASRDELAEERLAAETSVAGRPGAGARVVRGLPEADWVVRRSRPAVGFASVELTLPWLAASIAGVNERGVAAAVVCTDAPERDSRGAPALLLVQECLQRFEDVAGCVDWALKRPAAGAVRLVVADAAGRATAIQVRGERREVEEIAPDAGGELDKGVVLEPAGCRLRIETAGYEPAELRAGT